MTTLIEQIKGTLTQEVFAAQVGVDQVTVSKWVRGASQPSLDSWRLIAKAFPEYKSAIARHTTEIKEPVPA